MNSDKDILLSKWLDGTIADADLATLREQYELNDLNDLLSKQSDYTLELTDSTQLWESLDSKISSEKKPQPSNSRRGIALIGLLVLLSLATFYFFKAGKSSLKTIESPQAETVQHLFADQSEVILSPGSKLMFDETAWENERNLKLEGQAFFKVTSGSPFTVYAGPGTVQVLGTEFEIWEKEGEMRVSCIEGKVEVQNFSGDKQIIEIGQSVSLNATNMSDVTTHTLKKAEFLSGKYNFQKISIVSLAKEIERFYDVSVSLDDIDRNVNFSGVLVLNDLEKACSYIAETLDLRYERTLQKIRFYKD